MSNETLIGIIVTVICSTLGLFVFTKKNTMKINNKTRYGNIDMRNTTIGNEVNINKDDNKQKL